MSLMTVLILAVCGQFGDLPESEIQILPDSDSFVSATAGKSGYGNQSVSQSNQNPENFDDPLTGIETYFPPTVSSLELDSPAEDPATLMNMLRQGFGGTLLDSAGIQVSGWTDMSFTASTAKRNQLPMGMNYLANAFLLQQNWLRIEKPVDPNAEDSNFGFHSDTILPGSDYWFTIARGIFNDQLTANQGNPSRYGIDPVQFYAEAYLPGYLQGLDLKFGRFFAPFGVESIAAISAPLGSRSYTFIYNPFTQTGLLGNLNVNGQWKVKSGIIMGNDVFINTAASPYYVGGFARSSLDGKTSAEFTVVYGSGEYNQRLKFNNPQVFNLVLSHQMTDDLLWNMDAVYGFQNNVPQIGFANWYSFSNYLTQIWTEKFSNVWRLEFFDDVQGQRTGTAGLYTALTLGLNYKPFTWLWFRPEVRYDHNINGPFEGKPSLFTADLDVIIRW